MKNQIKWVAFNVMIIGMLSYIPVQGQEITQFVPEEWSGTATFIYTVTGKQFYSEIKHEVTISKGEGPASTKLVINYQTSDRAVNGKATGSGQSSLTIFFEENTYSITLTTPPASGSQITTYSSGSVTSTYGYDESSIMIENQKLGSNANILTGETKDVSKTESGDEAVAITRWKFVRNTISQKNPEEGQVSITQSSL